MIGAGIFAADPGRGFPAGTPEVVPVSRHGTLHFLLGGIGFLGLVAACLTFARRLAREDHRGSAFLAAATGVIFVLAFVAMAASGGSAAGLLGCTVAVILASGWLSALLRYR